MTPSRIRIAVVLLAAIGVAAAAIHLGSLRNGFTFDDTYIVVDNPLVTGEAGIGALITSHYWASVDPQGDLYRPLTIATYRATHAIAGMAPWAYHLTNLLIHGAVTFLLCLLCRRLSGSDATAALAGMLFAVHPVHVEAVASVVGRADLLAALFVIAAWLLRDRPVSSTASFACGLLSKENAIVLPGLLLIEDLFAPADRARRRIEWRRYAPAATVAAAFLALRFALISPQIESVEGPFAGEPAPSRLLTALDVLRRYVVLLVWPATLSADYSFDQIPIIASLAHPGALGGAAVALAGLAAAWLGRRRWPAFGAGVATFIVALLPVSNMLFGIGVVMAERLLYLPSAGACLAAAAIMVAAARAAGSRRSRVVLVGACLVACVALAAMAAASWRRTAVWRDPLTLFEATVRASPRSALAHLGLGSALQGEGRFAEAESAYLRSLAIDPGRAATRYNLATLLDRTGRREEAMREYEETIRIDPAHAQALNNLAILYQDSGRLEEAEAAYRRAIAIGPPRAAPMANLATALEAAGRRQEAIAAYREALRLHGGDEPKLLNNLGRLLVADGRPGEAIGILERAVAATGGAATPTVNLAAALIQSGQEDRALRLVTDLLDRHPDDASARRLLETLRRRRESAP